MKRKLICLVLSALMLLSLTLTATAEETLWRVMDYADLLDTAEESAHEETIRLLQERYGMDVVILTVDSLEGKSPQEYADDYYAANGYGCGEERSGLLLLVSMEQRDWYISTCGEAVYALTDYGISCLGEELLSGFSVSYDAGFRLFLNALPEYFEAYEMSSPIDGYANYSGDYYHGDQEEIVYYEEEFTPSLGLSLLLGLVVAGISILIMRHGMNTKRPRGSAAGYMNENSFHMRQQQDLFLYSNLSKVRKQEPKSSGGGSSVHRSSGGSRHGGGGGKF